MSVQVRQICVTGPESTGKTTLAATLAAALHAQWVPEAARLYAERVARPLTADDVDIIAREHIAMADLALTRAAHQGTGTLVLDTDLLSTVFYGRHYYGHASPWLLARARERLAGVYLLCDIDLPWEPDGVRDQPENRDAMLRGFRNTLTEFGATVVEIGGDLRNQSPAILRMLGD